MARFLEILSQHPYLTTCFGLYILLSFWHHGTFILFKLRGPPAGEGLQEGDSEVDEDDKPLKNPVGDKIKRRFRIHFTEHGPSDSPLAVFESHSGLPLECWGYAQKGLESKVSTLSYDRIGAGWSVLPIGKKRDFQPDEDLVWILKALDVIQEDSKGVLHSTRPLILVGHSLGCTLLTRFLKSKKLSVPGLILLDPPNRGLIKASPQMMEVYTDRLPRILSIAASLADLGLLRLASYFRVSLLPVTNLMKDRLPLRQVQALQEFSVNGQSVRTSEQELVSFVQLLKSDDDPTSDAVPCVAKTIVIVSDQVDTMVGEAGLSREEQSKRWIELMRAYSAKFKEGELVVDTECDPMSLCVSTRLPVYVNKILSDLPQKRK